MQTTGSVGVPGSRPWFIPPHRMSNDERSWELTETEAILMFEGLAGMINFGYRAEEVEALLHRLTGLRMRDVQAQAEVPGPPSPSREMVPGIIYVFEDADLPDQVKIGYTTQNPAARMKGVEKASGRTLRLIATLPGTMQEEKALHDRFAVSRKRGEWFTRYPALNEWIEQVKAA